MLDIRYLRDNLDEAEARINNLEELDNAIVQFEKERGDEAFPNPFAESALRWYG